MTFVITRSCCNDAACVPACPVNCIHPTPEDPDFGTTEMLYIDPTGCIDCGACLDQCPVSAIVPDYDLTDDQADFLALNAAWFDTPRSPARSRPPEPKPPRWSITDRPPLRVAVVGSGPAAFFLASELLSQRGLGASVDMFERLDTPGGLVRFGVAPDHDDTRQILRTFTEITRNPRFNLSLNITVGTDDRSDCSVDDLRSRYHAVVLATGASTDRRLDIPGEELPGSHSARELVGWYNDHPDLRHGRFDLTTQRVVIIGNGNVALDVARILASDPDRLGGTPMATHAVQALRASEVEEVVVAARKGALDGAFSTKELLHLRSNVDHLYVSADDVQGLHAADSIGRFKLDQLVQASRVPVPDEPRATVSLRFHLAPVEILGDTRVRSVRFERTASVAEADGSRTSVATGTFEEIECGMVVRAVGYRGEALADVPFDPATSTIPDLDGRVVDPVTGRVLPGLFVSGWIRRGPSGVIGSNKQDAHQTALAILDDFRREVLPAPGIASVASGADAPT